MCVRRSHRQHHDGKTTGNFVWQSVTKRKLRKFSLPRLLADARHRRAVCPLPRRRIYVYVITHEIILICCREFVLRRRCAQRNRLDVIFSFNRPYHRRLIDSTVRMVLDERR